MKKAFKILSIVAVVVILILALFICGMFALKGIDKLIKRNERINKSTTLSKYIEYHDFEYTQSTLTEMDFLSEDIKCDLLNDKNILYFNNDYYDGNDEMGILILEDYTIYKTAFDSEMTYSNGQQYIPIETDVKIKDFKEIHYELYLIGEDDKYYSIKNGEIAELLSENTTKYKYAQVTTLLADKTIKKVISIDIDTVVVIKEDGQIYKQEYKFDSTNIKYNLISEELILSSEKCGKVIDCLYTHLSTEADTSKTQPIIVISEKGLYYLKEISEQQYIDTEATYEMVESDIYSKYKNDIKYMNREYIFTTDNNITWTGMLCRDIDPEVK